MVSEKVLTKVKKIKEEEIKPRVKTVKKDIKKVGKIADKAVLSGPGFSPGPLVVDQTYSREQKLLRTMFGGRPFLVDPSDSNPPNIHGAMMKGGGILKNGDYSRKTARMFGLR